VVLPAPLVGLVGAASVGPRCLRSQSSADSTSARARGLRARAVQQGRDGGRQPPVLLVERAGGGVRVAAPHTSGL
jgi:hypothetical protein